MLERSFFSLQGTFTTIPSLNCFYFKDTNQAKTTISQSPQVANLEAAWVENQNAIRALSHLISEGLDFVSMRYGLMLAQQQLEELRKNTTTNRLATLIHALAYERLGYFAPGECTGRSECNDTSGYVQHATANIIGVVFEELTDDEKKEEIRELINGTFTEGGDLVQGASVQQTKEVTEKVRQYLETD
ncbi:unnamed protein product [Nippostrongylus brasiliensis]|uniref:Ferritin n=1 Tax=Nippostrongylus brasiliensis TaxID=27835 RepID=A0A0N4YJI3_NIPBR|nr:unnamed protein product [Nippostrongylus brasiliensis]